MTEDGKLVKVKNASNETFSSWKKVRFLGGKYEGEIGVVTDVKESPKHKKPLVRIRMMTSGEDAKGIWYSADSVTLDLIPVCHVKG